MAALTASPLLLPHSTFARQFPHKQLRGTPIRAGAPLASLIRRWFPARASHQSAPTHSGHAAARGAIDRRTVLMASVAAALTGALSFPVQSEAAICELVESPSGLLFCDTVEGSGAEATAGSMIKAHYSGRLLSGAVFDSSYTRGRPLVFRVGVGQVIRGWDLGILGTEGIPPMKEGGKRTLRIPAELAYGDRGAGCRGGTCRIPPGSELIFDVEFVGNV